MPAALPPLPADGGNWKQTCWKIILNSVLLVAACLIIAVCITNIARKSVNVCNSIGAKTAEEDVDRITLENHKATLERRINVTINRIQGGQTFIGTLPSTVNVRQLHFTNSDIGSHTETLSTHFPKKLVFDEMRKTYSSSNPNVPPERQFLCTWQMWQEEEKTKGSSDQHYGYRFLRQDFIQTRDGDSSPDFSCSMTIPSLSVWEHYGLLVVKVHPWGTLKIIVHQAVFNITIDHAPGKPTLEANQAEVRTEGSIKVYEVREDSNFVCSTNVTFPGYPKPQVTWWSLDGDEEGDGRPEWNGSRVGIAWNAASRRSTPYGWSSGPQPLPLDGWIWCEMANNQGASRSNRIKIVQAPKKMHEYSLFGSAKEMLEQIDNDMRKKICHLITANEMIDNEYYQSLCSVPIIRSIRFVTPKETK